MNITNTVPSPPSLLFLVPSQCILAKTLAKKQTIMSVVTKVAMQINCKLGGELWTLEVPVSIEGGIVIWWSRLLDGQYSAWSAVQCTL